MPPQVFVYCAMDHQGAYSHKVPVRDMERFRTSIGAVLSFLLMFGSFHRRSVELSGCFDGETCILDDFLRHDGSCYAPYFPPRFDESLETEDGK